MVDYEVIIAAIIFAIANIANGIYASIGNGTAHKIMAIAWEGVMVLSFIMMAKIIGSTAFYICGFGIAQATRRICKMDNIEECEEV